jgi:hypothetical protein
VFIATIPAFETTEITRSLALEVTGLPATRQTWRKEIFCADGMHTDSNRGLINVHKIQSKERVICGTVYFTATLQCCTVLREQAV